MITRALASIAGLFLVAQAVAGTPTPEQRYNVARKVLKTYCETGCGLGLGEEAAERKALDALWDATEDWTLAFLASHPHITIAKLKTKLALRDPTDFETARIAPARVTLVAPDLYAFSAYWGVTGNVFLIGRRDGRWAVVWDVRKAETGRFAALKAWRTDHAGAGCHDEEGHDRHYDCGPLYGAAFTLTPDVQGRVRFGLGGTYAQGGGFTVKSQVSFWRWDGTTAEPLLAETYSHELDDVASSSTPDTIVVRVKDEYKSIEACGACTGRQLNWAFRILPDRIVDEGTRPLYPEADFVDGVYARLQDHVPVSDAGTPQTLALMAKSIPVGRGDIVTHRDQTGAKICLSADWFDSTNTNDSVFMLFHVMRRENSYFIDKADRRSTNQRNGLCYQPATK